MRTSRHSIALALSLWFVCAGAWAEIDGPDVYVYVEISVREATIEGLRRRVALLQGSEYSTAADQAIDTQARIQVADAYALFDTNASSHAAYGTRNRSVIETWLDQNPGWKERLAALESQFRSLSNQLSALRRTS